MQVIRNESRLNYPVYGALPKKYKVVDEYLLRGPHPCFCDVFALKKEGVNQIYDFRHNSVKGFKWVERLACKFAGVEYIRKPYSFLFDKFPTQADYEALSKDVFLNGKNGGKSLFHCNSGTHRTALITAFYDITKGKSLDICKKEDLNYLQNVELAIDKHIISERYFSRNKVDKHTLNPIKRMKNVFNNKVMEVTNKAFELFVDMLSITK